MGSYSLVNPSTCPDFNSGQPILVEPPNLSVIRPAHAILSRSNHGTEFSTRSFLRGLVAFSVFPADGVRPVFTHPQAGAPTMYPTVRWTAYEFLLVRPIASLNFEGSKNTVVSTDGKESHGCNRWGMRFGLCRLANIGLAFLPSIKPAVHDLCIGMVVQERRSSTESARARRALG